MSTKEISAAAQALGRRGGMKSLGAKSKAELSAFGKAAAQKRWAAFEAGRQSGEKLAENFVNTGVGGMFSAGAICRGAVESSALRIVGGPDERDMDIVDRGAQQLDALAGAVGLKGAVVKACDTCGGSGASPGGVPCLGCEGTGSPEYLKVIGVDGHPIPERSPAYQAMIDKAKAEERAEGVSFPGDRRAPKPKRPLPKDGTLGSRVWSVIKNLTATVSPGGVEIVEIAKWAELDRATTRAALAHLTTAGHVVSEPKPGSRREKLWRLA